MQTRNCVSWVAMQGFPLTRPVRFLGLALCRHAVYRRRYSLVNCTVFPVRSTDRTEPKMRPGPARPGGVRRSPASF